MSINHETGSTERDSESDRSLHELFAHVAPRPAPPAADEAELRAAVYAEWDTVTGRRVLLRRLGGAAVAAAVIASVALLLIQPGTAPGPVVARVERVQGTVATSAGSEALRVGAEVAQGDRLTTGNGQTALRLTSGGSLRLAPQTQLTLAGAAVAELGAGTLYFDSDQSGAAQLAVVTRFGTLRDVGTQFVARIAEDRLEVGVRDGRVAIARGTDSVDASAGERLTLPRSGQIRRDSLALYGADWEWAERLAPPFEIDGRRLNDFLVWITQQTGREVAFADAATELAAREAVLSGSIDLPPLPKLAAVLATANLVYTIDGERIVIDSN